MANFHGMDVNAVQVAAGQLMTIRAQLAVAESQLSAILSSVQLPSEEIRELRTSMEENYRPTLREMCAALEQVSAVLRNRALEQSVTSREA